MAYKATNYYQLTLIQELWFSLMRDGVTNIRYIERDSKNDRDRHE